LIATILVVANRYLGDILQHNGGSMRTAVPLDKTY
jgi:hypothetical protein